MSIIATLMLGQAAAVRPPLPTVITVVPEQQTRRSLTEPHYNYGCKVYDKAGEKGILEFDFQGARGYLNAEEVLSQTESKFSVQSDKIGIFNGFKPWKDHKFYPSNTWPVLVLKKDNQLLKVNFGDTPNEEGAPKKSEIYIIIGAASLSEEAHAVSSSKRFKPKYYTRWVGFCDVTSTPQEPLSDEEVKALVQ